MNRLFLLCLFLAGAGKAYTQSFNHRVSYHQLGFEVITNVSPTVATQKYVISGVAVADSATASFSGFKATINHAGEIGEYVACPVASIPKFNVNSVAYDKLTNKAFFFGTDMAGAYRATVAIAGDTVEHAFRDTISSGSSVFNAGHVAQGYVVGGGRGWKDASYVVYPLIICLDTMGQELWREELALPAPTTNGRINGIRKLTDTSFIAVGRAYYVNDPEGVETAVFKPIIAAFTYTGRKLWEINTGHHQFIQLRDVAVEKDGSLVVCGEVGFAHRYWVYWNGLIYKLNPDGSLAWEVKVPGKAVSTINSLKRIVKSKDGNYLVAGHLLGTGSDSSHLYGTVIKTSQDGETIWHRRHGNVDDFDVDHRLNDIVETENDGLIAAGDMIAWQGAFAPVQQMWLIGMDENGCIDPADCPNYAVSVPEGPESKLRGVRIYPNPANNQVNISLPETFGGGQCQLSLYDMQGRAVEQTTVIATPGQPIPYSTAHLPNGLYMVRIGMGEKTAGGRLVVGR